MSKRVFSFKKSVNKENNKSKESQKGREPVDLSKLDDGVYELSVIGGIFTKKNNRAAVIVALQFDDKEHQHIRIDVPLLSFNFGKIIPPGGNSQIIKSH